MVTATRREGDDEETSVLIVLIVMLWGPTSGAAQALYGSLIGSVVDPADATVPAATVRVTHTGTNQSRSMQTNDAGRLEFPSSHGRDL